MKAYSIDLRQRVVDAYENKEGSMRKLAKRFSVSLTFVKNLIWSHQETGHVNPKPQGGGQPPAIDEQGCEYLSILISKQSDLTLNELCRHYEDKFDKKVSTSSMDRTLNKMKISYKKKQLMSRKNFHRKT